jgi:hypothetical protein
LEVIFWSDGNKLGQTLMCENLVAELASHEILEES